MTKQQNITTSLCKRSRQSTHARAALGGSHFDLFDIRFEFVGSGRPMTELASLRIINI